MLDPMMEQLLPGFLDEWKEIAERVTEHLIELEKAHDQARCEQRQVPRGKRKTKGQGEGAEQASLGEEVGQEGARSALCRPARTHSRGARRRGRRPPGRGSRKLAGADARGGLAAARGGAA